MLSMSDFVCLQNVFFFPAALSLYPTLHNLNTNITHIHIGYTRSMTLNSQIRCSFICAFVVIAQYHLRETLGRGNYFSDKSIVCFSICLGKRRHATRVNDEPFNCIQTLDLVSQIKLNTRVSQMLAPLATCCELPGVITNCTWFYMFLNIKRYIF